MSYCIGSDRDLDPVPDPGKILRIRIWPNDADPSDTDPQHRFKLLLMDIMFFFHFVLSFNMSRQIVLPSFRNHLFSSMRAFAIFLKSLAKKFKDGFYYSFLNIFHLENYINKSVHLAKGKFALYSLVNLKHFFILQ